MPSFVKIDQVVSEEKIKMRKANDGRRTTRRTTDDGRSVVAIAHMTFGHANVNR